MWIWIAAIVAIVFGALVSITRLVLPYLQDREKGSSLTESELEAIVGRAVRQAVQPLEDKIVQLERRSLSEGGTRTPAELPPPSKPTEAP